MSQPNAGSDPPNGFDLHEKHLGWKGDVRQTMRLLVPLAVKEELTADAKREEEAAEHAKRESIQRIVAERAAREAVSSSAASSAAVGMARAPVASRMRPGPTIPTTLPKRPRYTVPVYDWKAARLRFESLGTGAASGNKDVVNRDLEYFTKAMAAGPWRSVTSPSGWNKSLPALADEMPNFKPVVTFVSRRLALAELSAAPLQPPPVLLLGDPGVGKTYFAQRLAEALGTAVHRETFDNAQENSALRGSSRYWSNTHVGALWELIVLGKHANPVVLLDELDKGAHGSNLYRPVNALLTLLEPATASCVKDLSVDFEFDASHVWYIATANEADDIPSPVRSRFTEFTIEPPDIDGRLVLAHSIFNATLKRLVPKASVRGRFQSPTNMQMCRLAWLTAREIRMASERALGAAALARRHHFEDADFDEVGPRQSRKKRPPGGDGDPVEFVVIRR
ncbi:AAA family ATPase [Variovorax rhizosphaerae]|uniref:AAA family ATPase n=1 Tax=Variovorax rhizosphaerae TaxID=1836200 RepID=A0ABU8WTD7_9BURK